ncbi:ABC transporter substrate-binding protein [Prochlorothrix hollandica]|uniref:ABC transporter substrate-binding protein n=2 Tax=Prochlorothrix hollandica TaxID=1223 RepID=A0A0M2PSU2_PROHO|nr:ABC transporter substrate-binding protein [Prochlorothrix hollandica]KKI99194.1 ABC transporter substrate-binding protein [Prochlorothrix hollandica PCC 9006 = CALU 1027]
MKRRQLIKNSLGLMTGLTLAQTLKACGGSSPDSSPPADSQAGSSGGSSTAPSTLTMVHGGGFPNSLDLHRVGTNRPAYGVSWVLYDRLMTFGKKQLPDGSVSYDYTILEPELAESWEIAADGLSATFKLRDAVFHDGKPVTAADVKWSFDRAVSIGGFPTFQMKAGALESPDQFEVVDEKTFKVKFLRPDKLTLIDLAVPIPIVINSELVKPHLTDDDPWGTEWLNNNDAGGGAYQLGEFKPNERLTLTRFEDWKSGPLPQIATVTLLNVPEAGNRRALLERGDIDINFTLSEKDEKELSESDQFNIVSTPIENCLYSMDIHSNPTLNGEENPLGNVKVRQAIAYALPYEAILATAFYGQAIPLSGGSTTPQSLDWPQPSPYKTDLDMAKKLLAESPYPDGFTTTIAFNMGTKEWAEPTVILIQEALAKIGIMAEIEKVPDANFRSVLVEKSRPMIMNDFGGWLNYPDYFFFYAYHGQDATFNGGSYKNPTMDGYIEAALASKPGDPVYEESVKSFIELAWQEVPRVPLVQPTLAVAMQPNIQGYQYWFHRQLDFRQLAKT